MEMEGRESASGKAQRCNSYGLFCVEDWRGYVSLADVLHAKTCTNLIQAPGKADAQLKLYQTVTSEALAGLPQFLAEGLKIQEMQSVHPNLPFHIRCSLHHPRLLIQTFVHEIGKKPTKQEQVELALRRSKLTSRIRDHQRRAARYLDFQTDGPDEYTFEANSVFVDGDDGEVHLQAVARMEDTSEVPEKFLLALPSSLPSALQASPSIQIARKQEIDLREGECNDALQNVRLALGKKAFLFRTQVRPKGPKTGKTRPWAGIHAADRSLRQAAQLYRSSRDALMALDPPPSMVQKYKPLMAKELKTSTTLLDTSARGVKHDSLPWFWYLDVAADTESGDQLTECRRRSVLLHCIT